MSPAVALSPAPTPEAEAVDAALDELLRATSLPAELWMRALFGPARAFLSRPGKRFRARLVAAAWRIAGGDGAPPATLASIVEILHAGSLIVDDIEDQGQTRRGAPALHHVVGVPVALNTGNWMYCWPSALLAALELPAAIELAMHRDLQACLNRCHQGQALDLALPVTSLRRADVPAVAAAIARLKSGALLGLAATLGARAAGAGADVVAALGEFGVALGEGLQMLDDLGSVCAPDRAAKAEEDLAAARCTWPWAWLAEDADDVAWRGLVAALGADPRALAAELARRIGARGRARARDHLATALATLRARVGDGPALDAVADEIVRLEESYG